MAFIGPPPPPRLRDYQVEGLDQIGRAFNSGTRRVLYQLPTGAGKTIAFADLIREVDASGLRAVVLVHRDEIMQQAARSLRLMGVKRGFIAPGYPLTQHRVQVASVFSLVRRLDWLADYDPQLVVVDEAHHAPAGVWRKSMAAVPNAQILGVTATPRRLDGKPLDDLFDQLICGPSIAQLTDDGWLAPATVFTPATGPDLSKVKIRMGDFAVDQLSEAMSRKVVISGAVDEYERLCAGKAAIAFCVDRDHSKRVAAAFAKAGHAAEHVDGELPREERRNLMAALRTGAIDVLCNCALIEEGVDVPGVEAAILLRPTKSLALYLQQVGRALRPGKDLAFVLDHAGNVNRHGLPTARRRWTLAGKAEPEEAAGAELTRCPECGATNAAGSAECAHCGAVLRQPREPVTEAPRRHSWRPSTMYSPMPT